MTNTLKRLLSMLMVVLMVVSMVPTTVFAAEATETTVSDFAQLQAALAAGDANIKLSADITVDEKITVPDGTTIDLDYHTLYINVEESYYGNVTIENGYIVLGKDDVHVCDGYFLVNEDKALTLSYVDLKSAEGGIKGYAVFHLKKGADLYLSHSTVNIGANEYAEGYLVYAGEETAYVSIGSSNVKVVGNGIVHAKTMIDYSTVEIDAYEHGINRSGVTINESTVTIYGGTGRGITAQHGDLSITGKSVVNISDMGEATIELRNDKGLTVADTATVTVDAPVNNTTSGTITGNVTVSTAAAAAKIGEQGYATLAEALAAAQTMTGDVTVEIYDKVTLNSALSGSFDSIKFVGKDDDAEIYLDVQGYITATGKKVAFEDLTLSKSEGTFITNAGFMNVAFGIYDVSEVTYTNCTFANGAYAGSGKVTYTGCTFQKSWEKYGLWAYGDVDVTVDSCTFDNDRGIKMYAEGAAKVTDLTVKNTDFSKLTGKPAIVLTYGESVNLSGNTYSDTGVFELDLDGAPNGTDVKSDVAPTCKNDNGACGVLVDGKIYTTVAQAAEVATEGSTVTLLHNSTETVELAEGVTLNKNGFEAANVTVKVDAPQGDDFTGYTRGDAIWGEVWGNAKESFVIKVLDANGNVMGTTSLNNIDGIIDGDLSVTWTLLLDAGSNTDAYWTMEWTTVPTIDNQPAKVALWVDGVEVSGGDVVLHGPDQIQKIYAAVTDADGKILSYYTSAAAAGDAAVSGQTVLLLRETDETVELAEGVALNKNGFEAAGVTVKPAVVYVAKIIRGKVENTGSAEIGMSSLLQSAKYQEIPFETLEEAVAALQAGDELVLLADVTMSQIVVIDESVTFNGEGHKLTSTASRAINVSGADGVTIKNLTIDCSGERAINVIQNATNVTIDNVTATAYNYTVNVASSAPNAVVAIENSTLNGLNVVNVAAAGANVTVDNSTINCNDNSTVEVYAALCLNKDAVNGTITATNSTINIAEGTDSVKARNNAAGGVVTINGSADGVQTSVAVIDYPEYNVYHSFTTLEDAIEFASEGQTVTLIRDVEISDPLKITKDITIDGNGKKLTYTGTNRAIEIPMEANGANVTIKNLTVDASSAERGINYNTNGKLTVENVTVTSTTYGINFPTYSDNATVSIKDSKLTSSIALNIWGSDMAITVTDSELYSVENDPNFSYAAIQLNCDEANGHIAEGTVVTVNGGKISATDEKGETSIAVSNWTATGKAIISSTTEVIGEVKYAVATYGGASAYTLQHAIDEVIRMGYTCPIVLIRDIELTESVTVPAGANITIDLNGKTISQVKEQTAAYSMINNKGTLTITDSSAEQTGKISYTDSGIGGEYVSNTISNSGKLTVEAGTIENLSSATVAQNGYPQVIDNSGALTVKGGNINCASYAAIRIWCTTDDDTSVAIEGGNITGSIDLHNVNGNANKGTLTITGGNITKNSFTNKVVRVVNFGSDIDELAISIKGGNIDGVLGVSGSVKDVDMSVVYNVSGGTFTSAVPAEYCAEGYVPADNGDGTYGVKVKLPEVAITDIKDSLKDSDPDLTFALNFAVKDDGTLTEEYLQKVFEQYGNHYVDYVLTIKGLSEESVTFNGDGSADGYLAGQYDAWSENWVVVPPEGVTISNGESLYILEYAAKLLNKQGLRFTLAEVATIVQNFDCGIYFTPEFLAANPNMEVALELKVFTEDAEGNKIEDISVAKNTFTVPVPERPTATVSKLNNGDLSFAMNFIADEVTAEQLAYYKNWYADFELTINKDVTFNADGSADGYLSGQYDEWSENWINVPFDESVTLKANETLKIMAYAAELLGEPGLKLTYNDVYTMVKDFDCGVFFTDAFLAANPDLKVTLELRMYNPADESESYTIGETYVFTNEETYVAKNVKTNKQYTTLAAALSAAKSGETVQLLANIKVEDDVMVRRGTLDLNGYTLVIAEDYFLMASFNDTFVIDSSAENTGLVVADVSQLILLDNNTQLPLETAEGIRFADIELGDGWKPAMGAYEFWINSADAMLIEELSNDDCNVVFEVELNWNGGNQVFRYPYTDVYDYLTLDQGWTNNSLYLLIRNAKSVEGLTYTGRVVFAPETSAEVVVTVDQAFPHQ